MKNCKQCGTCCRNGGPTLHRADFELIEKNILSISCMVTIRKDEPVFSPISGLVEPSRQDLLKLSAPNSWVCPFLEQSTNKCGIYETRPLQCRLLKCWDTDELKSQIYKDSICRWDIIKPDSEIFRIVKQHDKECSFADINEYAKHRKGPNDFHGRANVIFERDLALREQAINKFDLSLEDELFYFGRPMFKSLDYYLEIQVKGESMRG